jgi:hypothetical protein
MIPIPPVAKPVQVLTCWHELDDQPPLLVGLIQYLTGWNEHDDKPTY